MGWLYVPGSVDSNSGSVSSYPLSELSVSWRGKPMPLRFWQRAWKKGGWIRLLFGMTSPRLMRDLGVERWILSLGATRASRSASPGNEPEPLIPAISGPTSLESSESANPLRCSWRMSEDTSNSDSERSPKSFEEWATTLRRVCLQRRKSARRIAENASSSWQTPSAGQYEKRRQVGQTTGEELLLPGQAVAWPTPRSSPNENRTTKPAPSHLNRTHGRALAAEAAAWATPSARDHKDGADPSPLAPTNSLLGRQAPRSGIVGRESSAAGRRLNPLFVEWLMGWPLGWTAFEPVGTESFRLWRLTHTNLLRRLSG